MRGCFRALWVSAAILVSGLMLSPTPASAALQKPAYVTGNHWVYDLEGSLAALPGFNTSQLGTFAFDLVGRVQVDVIGSVQVSRGNVSIPAVRVDTRSTGFLNGTFTIPGFPGTGSVTGTFTSFETAFWEDQSYLTIGSNGTTSYAADIVYFGATTHMVFAVRVNTTTNVGSTPPFDLDVGENATAALDTFVVVNSTVTFGGQTSQFQNDTQFPSTWRREVLARENVSVAAGSFPTYKLNQTLESFPGFPGPVAGGNETAYFSNDTGYYAKREAYANGSRVADMSLRSYSYGAAQSSGWSVIDLLLFIGLPLLLIGIVARYVLRHRERRIRPPLSPRPPMEPPTGGGPPAR